MQFETSEDFDTARYMSRYSTGVGYFLIICSALLALAVLVIQYGMFGYGIYLSIDTLLEASSYGMTQTVLLISCGIALTVLSKLVQKPLVVFLLWFLLCFVMKLEFDVDEDYIYFIDKEENKIVAFLYV